MTAIFLVKDIQWPTTICSNIIEVVSLALRCSVMYISELFLFNYYPLLFFFFFFWPVHATCGILVPWPGMEPMTPTLGAWKLNHWTIREVLIIHYFQFITCVIFIILLLLSTNTSSEKTAKLVNEHMSSQSIGDWHMWTGMCDTMKWAQIYKKKWEHYEAENLDTCRLTSQTHIRRVNNEQEFIKRIRKKIVFKKKKIVNLEPLIYMPN